MYTYTYTHIYIYIYTRPSHPLMCSPVHHAHSARVAPALTCASLAHGAMVESLNHAILPTMTTRPTANPQATTLDLRGFDSIRFLISRVSNPSSKYIANP